MGNFKVSDTLRYDGDQVIAEYDGSDTLIRKFVYGPGIDEPIIMIEPGTPDIMIPSLPPMKAIG